MTACELAKRLMKTANKVMQYLNINDISTADDHINTYRNTMCSCFNLGFEVLGMASHVCVCQHVLCSCKYRYLSYAYSVFYTQMRVAGCPGIFHHPMKCFFSHPPPPFFPSEILLGCSLSICYCIVSFLCLHFLF